MLDLFETKQIEDFSKKIRDVFNLLTISRKYRVVGSANLKNIRYVADYDLNELYNKKLDSKDALDIIYQLFKEKFQRAEKDPNTFITDLKCGLDDNGEPLRWNKDDIKKGYKISSEDGRKIPFQECILRRTTFKMDVIQLIDGVFTEFSDNYYIKIGNESNFDPHDVSRDHLLNSLKRSYDEYFYSYQNLFKGLKRAFSYYLMEGEDKNRFVLEKLLKFFNSPVGLLYKIKGHLGTLGLVIENKSGFRKPKIHDIKKNIQIILSDLNAFDIPALKHLKNAYKAKSMKQIEKHLIKAEENLFIIINKQTLNWVLKNKDVPLY